MNQPTNHLIGNLPSDTLDAVCCVLGALQGMNPDEMPDFGEYGRFKILELCIDALRYEEKGRNRA